MNLLHHNDGRSVVVFMSFMAASGLLAVALFGVHAGRTISQFSEWRDQAVDLVIDTTASHLATHRTLDNMNPAILQAQILEPLERADERCTALRNGGSIDGVDINRVKDAEVRQELDRLCPNLTALQQRQRAQVEGLVSSGLQPEDLGATSEFQGALAGAQQLLQAIREADQRNMQVINRLDVLMVTGLGVFAVAGIVLVRRHERQSAMLNRRNHLLLDTAADAIFGLDDKQRIVFANPATSVISGFEQAEILGANAHDLLQPTREDEQPYEQGASAMHRATHDGEAVTTTNECFHRSDGSLFPVEYSATPTLDDRGDVRCVVVVRDVTERRELEKAKDEFVSIVSHELRTPLTSIRGSLGLLAGGAVGEFPDSAKRMIDIAAGNTDRLVRLINDILDIERMNSGKATLERKDCSIGAIIEQAVAEMQGMATASNVAVVAKPADITVWADPDRIVQTLTNLIGNAIKFSPEAGRVTVSVEVDQSHAVVQVADQGRGIPQDKLESVFGRFQQVDASDSREKGGTGLGLAICQSIVQQHDGRIWVESEVDKGSRFKFTLPLLRARMTGSRPPKVGSVPTARVLVIDDNADVLAQSCEILRRRGYQAVPAQSGEEAMREVHKQRPDALVLNLATPGASGWEVLAGLREHEQTRDIPVVVLSTLTGTSPSKGGDSESMFSAIRLALSADKTGCRVVIVEDDVDLATVLQATFARHGIEALSVHTMADALQIIPEADPDLVVLDLTLPDGNGAELLERLRSTTPLRNVPIVVYTGRDIPADELKQIQQADVSVFTKSRVSVQQFEESVLELLGALLGPHK
jgi:PAS domain S-box-containing protein